MIISRRGVVASLASALAGGVAAAPTRNFAPGLDLGPPSPFSFERLEAQARTLASGPYRSPAARESEALTALDYDAMDQIRFRPESALWKDAPGDGAVEFFHLGRYAKTPVAIHLVENGAAREILYSEALFDIPKDSPARGLPPGLGFSGFRVMNSAGQGDWLAFQGASYFRAATPFNQYGLSARGLAIDTATPHPEEFPVFTSFWLERDPEGHLVVSALLESDSVAGAYRIVHRKGAAGLVQDVEAALHFRKPIERLGVAPLTSMFWYGHADRTHAVDWRPQIHDSDGLAMWTGAGERLWRPLANPPHIITNAFADRNPRGFGLMQRDRAFEDYQDDGVFYDRRPSVWVEPMGAWGAGSVQLVEIPTAGETDDNIVAFWTPAAPVKAGETLSLRYRLYWGDEEPTAVGVAKVVATRFGRGGRPGQVPVAGSRKFVVDFAGGRLAELTRQSGVEAVVGCSIGPPINPTAFPVVGTRNWRLAFDVAMPAGTVVDLRAFLRLGSESLSETWTYQAFG